ncbi:uncharacterized protein EAF01_010456 [Botrytis porri]|uniref:uncharacterized protein n=1 Tax=Botrytis porri TaxID=87229 RepID=UPI0018FF2E80|nr:uncharacterized protein EAF01_010456 [Botrytis porri]KAF7892376.1 hypothetical protein EAF01_010456 [Botrytis porri]
MYDVLGPLDTPDFYSREDHPYYAIPSISGPPAAFYGEVQNIIYVENMEHYSRSVSLEEEGITGERKALATRGNASSITEMVSIIKDHHGEPAFGVFAADLADVTLVHRMSPEFSMAGMNIITNRLANSSAQTGRTSVSILYPVYEMIKNVRALQYSNSVSSAALWTAYLIFYMHIGIITRAAFAVAVGVHIMLMVVYLIAYFINNLKEPVNSYEMIFGIQGILGLTSPAANLLRTFFIASDNFGIPCVESGWYDLHPIAFQIYGGVYINLILQIMFCSFVVTFIESGSSAWFSKLLPKKKMPATPAQLDFGIEGRKSPNFAPTVEHGDDIPLKALKGKGSVPVLVLSKITKFFKSLLALQEISLAISTNETFVLVGANGAGKTTAVNMIRGLINPNHSTITIDGINVLASPQQARIHTGVYPQDDAIDELTVRQTLSFHASIKELRDIRGNVDGVMRAFGTASFAHRLITKRAIRWYKKESDGRECHPRESATVAAGRAFDGATCQCQTRVVEDLRSLSTDRAILIAAHSIEETEALATKVAIVDKKMLALGTTLRFGGIYRVRRSMRGGVCYDRIREDIDRDQTIRIRKLKREEMLKGSLYLLYNNTRFFQANLELRYV